MKKKTLWKWPVNWSFSELFFFLFFRHQDPKPEKKSHKSQQIKQVWPKIIELILWRVVGGVNSLTTIQLFYNCLSAIDFMAFEFVIKQWRPR